MTKKIFFLLLLIFLWPSALMAQEEVMQLYESDILVQENSSLLVRERIVVYAAGQEIKHGIYRDFPTKYKDQLKNNHVVDFEVLDVKMDGESVPYNIFSLYNGKRVRIGNPDRFVSEGLHAYEIYYRTKYQLGFFEDYDELYWNVTGNDWSFPILKARAIVTLPQVFSQSDIQMQAYTGYMGEQGRDYTEEYLDGGR